MYPEQSGTEEELVVEIGGIYVRRTPLRTWTFYGGVFECETCKKIVRCDDLEEAQKLEAQHRATSGRARHETRTYMCPIELEQVAPIVKIEDCLPEK